MKILSQLKIAGYYYDVISKDMEKLEGILNPGAVNLAQHRIFIDTIQCIEEQESSLIHEILEILNYIYELNLEHDTLASLEASLYQILKDNHLLENHFEIPVTLKIFSFDYNIIISKDRMEETGADDGGGTHYGKYQKIFLDKECHPDQMKVTFLHEILEAVNRSLALQLPHKTIFILETGLYQVFKDNNFLQGELKEEKMKVKKYFSIKFDEPSQDWLNKFNLQFALEKMCKNTRFEVEQLNENYHQLWDKESNKEKEGK